MNLESVSGILRYLHDHKDAKNVHLKSIVSNHYRLHNTMEAMRDAGLVEIEYRISPKKEYRYWLTQKGERVATKLLEIEDMIDSPTDD